MCIVGAVAVVDAAVVVVTARVSRQQWYPASVVQRWQSWCHFQLSLKSVKSRVHCKRLQLVFMMEEDINRRLLQVVPTSKMVEENEVLKLMTNLDVWKESSSDGMPGWILKGYALQLKEPVQDIELSLKEEVSAHWKRVNAVPI